MIKRIDHVAIAVKNLDATLQLWENLFDLKPSKIEVLKDQGVKAALLSLGDGSEIELMEPIEGKGGIASFLKKRGEGIHHICLEVEDTDSELTKLEHKGIQLIDKRGRPGLSGKVGFLHPKSTGGVLIELKQKA